MKRCKKGKRGREERERERERAESLTVVQRELRREGRVFSLNSQTTNFSKKSDLYKIWV